MDVESLKRVAAEYALRQVRSGMTIGLGSGSTASHFVALLGEALQTGMLNGIRGVPTSEMTATQAQSLGIPLISLSECSQLDLAVDGADEVDPQLNLIKGLGRALLREKLIELHADRLVIVVDESKLVSRLGTQAPLPVEVVRFEAQVTFEWLAELGCGAQWDMDGAGACIVTDNGNHIVHCQFEDGIRDLVGIQNVLANRPGVVEHGLFLGMAHQVIVAGQQGVEILENSR